MKKTFVRDLALGKVVENRVINLLNGVGFNASVNADKTQLKYYDIVANHDVFNEPLTFEIKNDVYANKSGNVAIETFNPKTCKPSGLGITKAMFWVHHTDRTWITLTSKLRQFTEDIKPARIIAAGGDDNATLYLYKADLILPEIFILLDDSPYEAVCTLYKEWVEVWEPKVIREDNNELV